MLEADLLQLDALPITVAQSQLGAGLDIRHVRGRDAEPARGIGIRAHTRSWLAITVSSSLTSFRSPPVGPLSIRMRTPSITVSVGRTRLFRSAMRLCRLRCMMLRSSTTPIRFLAPRVRRARAVVLGDGHVDQHIGIQDVGIDIAERMLLAPSDIGRSGFRLAHHVHLAAGSLDRIGNSRNGIRRIGRAAKGVVHHAHPLGARAQASVTSVATTTGLVVAAYSKVW